MSLLAPIRPDSTIDAHASSSEQKRSTPTCVEKRREVGGCETGGEEGEARRRNMWGWRKSGDRDADHRIIKRKRRRNSAHA